MPNTHDSTTPEDTERCLDALLRRTDSDAPDTHAVDNKMASLLRALADLKTPPADDAIQERVWHRILFASYAPPQIQPIFVTDRLAPAPKRRLAVLWLAAACVAISILGVVAQPRMPQTNAYIMGRAVTTLNVQYTPPNMRLQPGLDEGDAILARSWRVRRASPQHFVE
ncbi:MAG: hypothetical protein H7Y11_11190 [Armatimonadetes bacterium]|nr:hypothetical protein [Anaerolineae bacterium]